jgi:hypothetical protein
MQPKHCIETTYKKRTYQSDAKTQTYITNEFTNTIPLNRGLEAESAIRLIKDAILTLNLV